MNITDDFRWLTKRDPLSVLDEIEIKLRVKQNFLDVLNELGAISIETWDEASIPITIALNSISTQRWEQRDTK